jgi:hypothetical protein
MGIAFARLCAELTGALVIAGTNAGPGCQNRVSLVYALAVGSGNSLRPLGWQRRLTDPSQARKLQPLYFLGTAQVAKTEQKAVTEIELAPPHGCCHARRKELKNDRLEIHKRRIRHVRLFALRHRESPC